MSNGSSQFHEIVNFTSRQITFALVRVEGYVKDYVPPYKIQRKEMSFRLLKCWVLRSHRHLSTLTKRSPVPVWAIALPSFRCILNVDFTENEEKLVKDNWGDPGLKPLRKHWKTEKYAGLARLFKQRRRG